MGGWRAHSFFHSCVRFRKHEGKEVATVGAELPLVSEAALELCGGRGQVQARFPLALFRIL
jgi:hypothetical protein